MNMSWWYIVVPVGVVLAILAGRRLYHLGKVVLFERAKESFLLQHERLEKMVLEKAALGGTPRGLRWVSCVFEQPPLLAWKWKGRAMMALVPATIGFEAIAGSDMEDVLAVPLPRQGTAVLQFQRGEWHATGRVFFNLEPAQVLNELKNELTGAVKPA